MVKAKDVSHLRVLGGLVLLAKTWTLLFGCHLTSMANVHKYHLQKL